MKKYNLLVEASDNIEVLTEQSADGGKQLYLEGIFAQAEVKNGNGRIYTREVMELALEKYVHNYVAKNRALGELNHPEYPFPNPEHAAIRITEMSMNGNNVYGKALVLNTPKGQIIKGLLEGGFAMGVSTRGLGSIKEQAGSKYVQKDFMMTAVDAVDNPSAPNAFPKAIYENKQWALNESTGNWVPVIDEAEDIKVNEQLFFEQFEALMKKIKQGSK